jgi:hypothetical protein
MDRDLEFSFEGHVVGCFEEAAYPSEPGRYRYMPYRGPGHYDLTQALARAAARCSYSGEHGTVEFDVAAVPEYGVLQIDVVYAAFAAPTTSPK